MARFAQRLRELGGRRLRRNGHVDKWSELANAIERLRDALLPSGAATVRFRIRRVQRARDEDVGRERLEHAEPDRFAAHDNVERKQAADAHGDIGTRDRAGKCG